MIESVTDVYEFAREVRARCADGTAVSLGRQVDDAMHLGSSGLEALGAIRSVLHRNRRIVVRLMGAGSEATIDEIITFIDKAFGM